MRKRVRGGGEKTKIFMTSFVLTLIFKQCKKSLYCPLGLFLFIWETERQVGGRETKRDSDNNKEKERDTETDQRERERESARERGKVYA